MRFSVLTYNVLHSMGAKRLLRGRPTQSWAVDRLQRAAEEVRRLSPDVACFQEFDEAAEEAFTRNLEGYSCAAVLRNEALPPKDGCGIFLRKTLRATQSHSFRLRDVAERHFPDAANLRGGAGFAAALWRELHEKLTLANAVEVSVESGRKVWISTCHLYWDPRYPDLKLLQAWLLERELSALSGGKPLILAGDLNSTPLLDGRSQGPKGAELSGVYELMTRGRVDVQHPHHPVLLRPGTGILAGVRPQDVPEFQVESFQSAAQEAGGEVTTNISADFRGCLDYIFYRGDRKSVV